MECDNVVRMRCESANLHQLGQHGKQPLLPDPILHERPKFHCTAQARVSQRKKKKGIHKQFRVLNTVICVSLRLIRLSLTFDLNCHLARLTINIFIILAI